jgi:hypothetical protein
MRDDGAYVLHFDGKYEVQMRPEGRNGLLLRHDLPALKKDRSRNDTLQRMMRINLLLAGRKHSTLTLDNAGETPFLYDLVTVEGDVSSGFRSITGFVNEVAAFHKALDRRH